MQDLSLTAVSHDGCKRCLLPADITYQSVCTTQSNNITCHTALRCALLHCITLCCAVLCCAVLCCAVLCCAVLCRAVLRHAVLRCIWAAMPGSVNLSVPYLNIDLCVCLYCVCTVQVTAILVMYGLPRLLTGSILAHECMHAWFVLNYIDCCGKAVNEGLSQLMALMWLEAQEDQVCLSLNNLQPCVLEPSISLSSLWPPCTACPCPLALGTLPLLGLPLVVEHSRHASHREYHGCG